MDDRGHTEGARKLPARRERDITHLVEVAFALPQARDADALEVQVQRVQRATARPLTTTLRRSLFFWFRIYVHESGRDSEERVNIRIPVPLPLVGALFRRRLTRDQALKLVTFVQEAAQSAREVGPYVESCMALEFLRVEEDKHGKRSVVVIGLD